MKAKISLFVLTMLAYSSVVFAAPGAAAETPKSYYNLTTIQTSGMGPMAAGTTTLVLSQGAKECTSKDWTLNFKGKDYSINGTSIGYYSTTPSPWGGTTTSFTSAGQCVASVEDTPANLATIIKEKWINGLNMSGVALELGSNIDLKEFTAKTKVGECEVNHVPLPMMENTEFNGNGFTISHLCYATTVTATEPMTAPVGFFESAASVSMRNVKLNGVRIYIDGTSIDGKDYYPVGAFVGTVDLLTIDSVSIANDSIQAPIAGGVVGFVKNSTISNITGDDDINISNTVSITTGYAGSEVINKSAGTLVGHNVFLGGVAGVAVRTQSAEDATFKNDSVKVDVHDYALGHRSALGGIAGLNQTIGGPANNLYVYTKNKDGGEVIPSKISGGASMGGLFGVLYVPRDNNVTDAGNFVVSNSKFEGKLYDAVSPSVMAVGGILGLDSSDAQTSVRVMNSTANIDIKDSLKVAGLYQYFAGGIVGYGSSCVQGGATGGDFLSVIGAKTEGSIALSASGAAVSGLHSDAFLGGVVGSACIAQTKGLGLTNDTSSVQITSKVKTSVDDGKVVNGAYARDSVYIGGIVGFASIMVYNAAATVAHLYYEGSIVVEDSLNNVFVGGVLGGFTNDQGGRTLILNDVFAKSESQLIKYTAKEAGAVSTSNVQVANIGGVCGLCNEISEMSLVAAVGDISVIGKHAGDYLYVGGLIGKTLANNVRTVVQNTYNVGDISVTANNASLGSYDKKVGYLIGKAELNKGYEIKSSYHFGEDDDDTVTLPVGALKTEQETNTWVDSDSISYVMRNGSASPNTRHNGTEIAKTMRSSQFAGTLNAAYADSADYVWTFVKNNNSSLPFFAKGQYEPVAPTPGTHVVVFAGINGDPIDQQTVVHGGAATAPADSMTKIEGYTFKAWDKDFDNIISDLTVTALYDTNTYTVRFFDFDDTQFGAEQTVKYQNTATDPGKPERVGYTFTGWDDSTYLSGVTKDLDIHALYEPNKYWIVFKKHDGEVFMEDSIPFNAAVPQPVDVPRDETDAYTYTFKSWTPEVVNVNGDAVYTATYDSTKKTYAVTFVDYDDTPIGDVQMVEYGDSAVAPADPTREGYAFVGWDRKFDVITKSIEVKAVYELLKFWIVFKDFDGSEIKADSLVYGATVVTPKDVKRASTAEYKYTFKNWTPDVAVVSADAEYTAQYDSAKVKYAVTFVDYDETPIGDTVWVEYGSAAVAPAAPTREGYKFTGWDRKFDVITKSIEVKAVYERQKYWVVFQDYNGDQVKADSVLYEGSVSAPKNLTRSSTAEYSYLFKGWDPVVTKVLGDKVYKAVYDSLKNTYSVTFLDYDGSRIGDVQTVEYGAAAVAPAEPKRDGFAFFGWDGRFDKIIEDTEVKALYEKLPESSSSAESSSSVGSSSSVESSSSVIPASSSSVFEESSSSVGSSSSVPEVSSSSITGEIKIVKPEIKQSGNAILLTFDTENAGELDSARVVVTGENGGILDTVIKKSVVNGGQWQMTPAPIGKFTVTLTVGDQVNFAEYEGKFEVASEIKAAPGSWQMVSLSALDKKSVKSDDAAFYWWDERNPVGDYWQYRAFDGGAVEGTRGFWYGTADGEPLVIRESTGSKESEIVWELDSLYSGWNLVANPYGWYVDMSKGSADNDAQVTFWRWNSATGNYDPMPKVLGPYEAVWAKVSKSTTWRMSAAPEFKIEERTFAETKKAMHKDAAGMKGAWNLRVSLADDYGRQDSWNVIGAGAEESLEEPPAGMGNHVSLAIRNSEKGMKLAKSIKAVADEYSWILDVSASTGREGKLQFEGVKELSRQGLKLFVTAEGVTTEITNEKSLNVALAKSAKQVEVRVAAGNAVVASSKISGFGSTLAGGTLQLGFTAPEALAGARASYAVVSVDGKKVAAGQFKATAGTNQFSLNAPKNGVYFVRIKVGSQQLSGKVLVK